jgi:hypothetical protein
MRTAWAHSTPIKDVFPTTIPKPTCPRLPPGGLARLDPGGGGISCVPFSARFVGTP